MRIRRLALVLLVQMLVASSAFALDLGRVIPALEHGSSDARKAAIREIAAAQPSWLDPLIQPLAKAATDRDPDVRFMALATLSVAGRVSEKYGRRMRGLAHELIRLLADPDPRVRGAAADVLACVQPHTPATARRALLASLNDADPDVRGAAVVALVRLRAMSGRERDAVLSVMTDDPSASVRASTASLVSRFPVRGRATVQALTTALSDEDPAVRNNAADSLAFFGRDATSALDELLQLSTTDPDSDVRQTAELAINTIEHAASP